MTLNFQVQIIVFCLIFAIIHYNFVIIDGFISYLDKTTFEQDLLRDQTEFDLYFCMTLAVKIIEFS